jgi:hypothetical protein
VLPRKPCRCRRSSRASSRAGSRSAPRPSLCRPQPSAEPPPLRIRIRRCSARFSRWAHCVSHCGLALRRLVRGRISPPSPCWCSAVALWSTSQFRSSSAVAFLWHMLCVVVRTRGQVPRAAWRKEGQSQRTDDAAALRRHRRSRRVRCRGAVAELIGITANRKPRAPPRAFRLSDSAAHAIAVAHAAAAARHGTAGALERV